jgi:hypothetical protein
MSPRRRGRGRGGRGAAGSAAAPSDVAGLPAASADSAGPQSAQFGEAAGPALVEDPATVVRPANGPTPIGANAAGPQSIAAPRHDQRPRPATTTQTATPTPGEDLAAGGKASCTLAQMRRFIKSRPYVPVHELRRRFLIEGIEDEVSPMTTGQGTLYVGLPEREAGYLGELVKAGEVGCELLLDPTSPGVVGVFPMRPVARQ